MPILSFIQRHYVVSRSRVGELNILNRIPTRLFSWSRTPRHSKHRTSHSSLKRLRSFPPQPGQEKRGALFSSIAFQRYNANRRFGWGQKHDRKFLHTTACHECSQFIPTPPDQDPSLEWQRSGQEFINGPDQVIPSTAISTWDIQGAIRLSPLGTEPAVSRLPVSIPTMLLRRAEAAPNIPALAVKRNNQWIKWTYEEYYEETRTVAKGLIALGLEPFNGVCILGFNCPEWFIANLGSIFAGGIPAGIYTTNSASACTYIAKDCQAKIFVVEDEQQLSKVLQCRDKMATLKAIVQYRGTPGAEGVLSWQELLALGAEQTDEALNQRLRQLAVNRCATLIYTSGTTGNPKGVMLSHDNITWMAHHCSVFGNTIDNDVVHDVVSYLPLSHIAAQHTDMYLPLTINCTTYFAQPDALKGTLIDTLREVQPTLFVAVPRVWEKFYEQMKQVAAKNTGLKLKIIEWAKSQAVKHTERLESGKGTSESFQFKLADKLILSKVRHALGQSRCVICSSSAAPITIEMLKYFRNFNIVIGEAYGLSETSGPHTLSVSGRNIIRHGSVGVAVPGVALKLDKMSADGQGEICAGGRNIMMGYLHHEEKTKQAIDKEGWLHSEDLGRIDKDGFVYITGRLKELLITAGGENVAPVPIEDNIKAALPCLSNVMLVGDKLKFLSVLMTFKTEPDPETMAPSDKLTNDTKKWIDKHGACNVTTVKDVMNEVYQKKNSKLINAIESGVMLANTKSVSRASRVKKWAILPKDFSIPGGELGPTLKLKRKVAVEKYKDVIEELYKSDLDEDDSGALG